MTTLALPADTVQFYNDGPDFPATPLLQGAERAYRDGFNVAANAAGSWRRATMFSGESLWNPFRVRANPYDHDRGCAPGVATPGSAV